MQLFYDKADPDHGGESELPLLVYVMERNNMIRNLLFLLAVLLGGADKAKAASKDIDQILHLADEEKIQHELDKRQQVFDAWLGAEPFKVQKLPTIDELMAQARKAERMQRSRFQDFAGLADSIIPGDA